ncbi:hypothetical protein Q3G72_028072 [Acer saccharum]|nr:hypothetical protein Q3G72_028072 [Acer saccharum]
MCEALSLSDEGQVVRLHGEVRREGKSFFEKDGGKSKSIFKGSTKGIEAFPAYQINIQHNKEAGSGGYVGKITDRHDDNDHIMGKPNGVSHDTFVGLIGPIPQTRIDTSDRRQWILVKGMEKDLDDTNAVMEDMETYSEAYTSEVGKDTYDHSDEVRDQGSADKKNVRKWK